MALRAPLNPAAWRIAKSNRGKRTGEGFVTRLNAREALGRPVMEICPMTRLALSTSTARQLGYKVDVGRGERIGRVAPEW